MKLSKVLRKQNDKLLLAIEKIRVQAKEELDGFDNLEHSVRFDLFPGSLLVQCQFASHDQLDKAKKSEKAYQKKLHNLLLKQGIVLKDAKQNLQFCVKPSIKDS